MSGSKSSLVSIALMLISSGAFAQSADAQKDQQAYCQYVSQQAMAQRDLLLSPSAVAGVTQPETGLATQLVWGLSSSLSNMRKAGLTVDAARKDCELYVATTATQQHLQFALPRLEKSAFQHRLKLIQKASKDLDTLIARITAMVDAHDATRPMLFALQTSKIKLDADRTDTQARIALLYTPDDSDRPLKELLAEKQANEVSEQKALAKLNKQNDWDISLSVGAHQQVNPLANTPEAYGAFTISYNLASHAVNKHLDEAATAYGDWKSVQQSDVIHSAQVLKQLVADSVAAQESRLKSLQDEEKEVKKNLQIVGDTDTSAALDFRDQLTSAQLLLHIEICDAGYRVKHLKEFLATNY